MWTPETPNWPVDAGPSTYTQPKQGIAALQLQAVPVAQALIPQYDQRQSLVQGQPVISHYLDPNTGQYLAKPTESTAAPSTPTLDVSKYNRFDGSYAGNPNISGEDRDEYGVPQRYNEYITNPDGSVKINYYDASGNFTGSKNYSSLIQNSGGGFFGALSDAISSVGSSIAQNPLLSAGVGAALVSAGVPPEAAAALIKANQGGNLGQIAGSAATAGLISNALAPSEAVSTPVYSPSVTPTELPPFMDAVQQAVQSVAPEFNQLSPEQIAQAVQPVQEIVSNVPVGVQVAQAQSNVLSDAAGSFPITNGVIDLGEVSTSPEVVATQTSDTPATLGDLLNPQAISTVGTSLPDLIQPSIAAPQVDITPPVFSTPDYTQSTAVAPSVLNPQPQTNVFAQPDYSQYTPTAVTPTFNTNVFNPPQQPEVPTNIFAQPDYSQYTQNAAFTPVQPTFDTNVSIPTAPQTIGTIAQPPQIFANPDYSQYTQQQAIPAGNPPIPTDIFANPDYSQYTGATMADTAVQPTIPTDIFANPNYSQYPTDTFSGTDAAQAFGDYATPQSDLSQVMGGYTMPSTMPGGTSFNPSGLLNTLTGTPIGQAATIGALGSLLQGYLGSNAANTAAQIQAAATQNAINQMTGVYNQQTAQNAPYRGLGYQAANTIGTMLPGQAQQYDAMGNPVGTTTGSGYLTQQFTPQDFAAGIDPGYAFRLQQGQMANQRAGNVGGGALSGNVLKGLQDYTQGAASQEYGNAFNRFQTQRQNIYNNLANIAGIGQTSQGQQNQLAQNLAQTTAQMQVGNAAAQAAGQIGQANAYGNAIGGIGNAITLAALLGQKQNVATPTVQNPVTNASNTIGSLGNLANAGSALYNLFG